MQCINCGEYMRGDGYTSTIVCPNADEECYWYLEPDADPVYCQYTEDAEDVEDA